jgi:hypothetical protein
LSGESGLLEACPGDFFAVHFNRIEAPDWGQ